MDEWLSTLSNRRLVSVECGAGRAIPTVRFTCQNQRGHLIRINPREAQAPKDQLSLALGAMEALTAIDDLLKDP